jgi:GNAT superfamily N-acetyltransferase
LYASALLLDEIETYYDAVPRGMACTENVGPFTLFINIRTDWPYYARPSRGATRFTLQEVGAVRERQRQLNVPEAFEWVDEVTPGLAAPAEAAGLEVGRHPLMLLQTLAPAAWPADVEIRLATPSDDLLLFSAVADVAFGQPSRERDAAELAVRQARLRHGETVMAVAFADGRPVGVGSHNPLGSVTEIVGVGVLPAYRRRGIAAALSQALVEEAIRRGIRTIFLSAGDSNSSRVYARIGFASIATACTAEPGRG